MSYAVPQHGTHESPKEKDQVRKDPPTETASLAIDTEMFEDDNGTRQRPWPTILHDQLNGPAIEHMVSLKNWELTCRLIRTDPVKTSTKPCVQVPALITRHFHPLHRIAILILCRIRSTLPMSSQSYTPEEAFK